jgi:hypothetical protein
MLLAVFVAKTYFDLKVNPQIFTFQLVLPLALVLEDVLFLPVVFEGPHIAFTLEVSSLIKQPLLLFYLFQLAPLIVAFALKLL